MKNRTYILRVTIIGLALLARLISPVPVHADGETTLLSSETPVETSTPEPTNVAPTKSPTPELTDPAPTKPGIDLIPTELQPAEPVETTASIPPADLINPTPDPVETPSLQPTREIAEPILTDVLQELPEDTSVVVLDENGQASPLVSQQASQAITHSYPIWCPAGQAPTPGSNGCSIGYATVAELVAIAGPSMIANGTIWITSGSVSDSTDIAIDGSIYSNWANYTLTLQGGWSGIDGDTTIGANSVFYVPITIANWNNDVTISHITTSSSIGIINDPWGSTPNQIGNVTIENVNARHLNVTTNSAGHTISIRDSSFSNSGLAGVYIDGWLNSLTISNSHFDYNQDHGLVVYNGWEGITIANSTFVGNGQDGAALVFAGNLIIDNSSFTGNFGNGIAISGSDSVTINNSNFSENLGHGMVLSQGGDVILANSTLNGNFGTGVTISDAYGINIHDNLFTGNLGGGINIVSTTNTEVLIENVTVDQSSGFGLGINTAGGNVTIKNSHFKNTLEDYSNPYYGWGDGVDIFNSGGIVAISQSHFIGNTYDGLFVVTAGDLLIDRSEFTANHVNGVRASIGGNLFIDNSQFTGNFFNGVGAYSAGDFSIDNSTFAYNHYDGVSAYSDGNLSINNSQFTGNLFSGVNAYSAGNFSINSSQFTDNDLYGAIVGSIGDTTIHNSQFSRNNQDGLNAYIGGNLFINNNQFSNNLANGLYIFSTGNITINDVQFNSNLANGLNIFSAGNITITDSDFRNPGATGAFIRNAGNVIISGGSFSGNAVGLSVSCVTGFSFDAPATTFVRNITNIFIDPACPIKIDPPQPQTFVQPQGKLFALDCSKVQNRYVVPLANGDRGEIFCPVNGEASIDRVDNTILPDNLPAGYTYASAFNVIILQNDKPIPVITEGGYITASFVAQHPEFGDRYSILYWDLQTRTWIPLKDFFLNEHGKPQTFPLFPGVEGDKRLIHSGVSLVTKDGVSRVEVTTNFPGIFVLAQQ
jgi:hypothetical protein